MNSLVRNVVFPLLQKKGSTLFFLCVLLLSLRGSKQLSEVILIEGVCLYYLGGLLVRLFKIELRGPEAFVFSYGLGLLFLYLLFRILGAVHLLNGPLLFSTLGILGLADLFLFHPAPPSRPRVNWLFWALPFIVASGWILPFLKMILGTMHFNQAGDLIFSYVDFAVFEGFAISEEILRKNFIPPFDIPQFANINLRYPWGAYYFVAALKDLLHVELSEVWKGLSLLNFANMLLLPYLLFLKNTTEPSWKALTGAFLMSGMILYLNFTYLLYFQSRGLGVLLLLYLYFILGHLNGKLRWLLGGACLGTLCGFSPKPAIAGLLGALGFIFLTLLEQMRDRRWTKIFNFRRALVLCLALGLWYLCGGSLFLDYFSQNSLQEIPLRGERPPPETAVLLSFNLFIALLFCTVGLKWFLNKKELPASLKFSFPASIFLMLFTPVCWWLYFFKNALESPAYTQIIANMMNFLLVLPFPFFLFSIVEIAKESKTVLLKGGYWVVISFGLLCWNLLKSKAGWVGWESEIWLAAILVFLIVESPYLKGSSGMPFLLSAFAGFLLLHGAHQWGGFSPQEKRIEKTEIDFSKRVFNHLKSDSVILSSSLDHALPPYLLSFSPLRFFMASKFTLIHHPVKRVEKRQSLLEDLFLRGKLDPVSFREFIPDGGAKAFVLFDFRRDSRPVYEEMIKNGKLQSSESNRVFALAQIP